MTKPARIRTAAPADADVIADIYNHYIRETVVTFEVVEVSVAQMARRMTHLQSNSFPWLVAERDDRIVGYAYASPWHERHAYRFSAETTVYLAPGNERLGIGSALYEKLLELVKKRGIHTAIGGIALPNDASVALHEKLGFEKAAHYREVGFKFDQWIDVGYWQRML